MPRRILCLALPRLATDRLRAWESISRGASLDLATDGCVVGGPATFSSCRTSSSLPSAAISSRCAREPIDPQAPLLAPEGGPIAVFVRTGGCLRVAACDGVPDGEVRPGMPLAEARARVPGLRAFPLDAAADAAALRALGDRAVRFGPEVSLVPPEAGRPAAVLVEVGGSAHLFGGEAALAARAVRALGRAGFGAAAAVAGTLGTAYALAGWGRACEPLAGAAAVVERGREAVALGALPVAALRLDPDAVRRLGRLGVRTVADLLALERPSVARRFGPEAALRIAQALGEVAEPPARHRPPERFAAHLELPEPTDRRETILLALRRLLGDAAAWLVARGEGARRLAVGLAGEGPAGPARVEIDLAAPRRDGRRLLALVEARLASVRASEGVGRVELEVLETGPVRGRQLALAAGRELLADPAAPGEAAVEELIERLVARLGAGAVLRAELAEGARPERAFRLRRAAEGRGSRGWGAGAEGERPVRLYETPRPVAAPGRLRVIRGPERSETGWWEGAEARDYFEVEDERGRRLWAFRAGERWWVHGSFF